MTIKRFNRTILLSISGWFIDKLYMTGFAAATMIQELTQ